MTRQAMLAAAAALTMIATPALAERGRSEAATSEATAPSAQASPDANGKAERKTCRTYENTVSRMKSERLCLTRDEWRKFDDQR